MSDSVAQAKALLAELRSARLSDQELATHSVALAALVLAAAEREKRAGERSRAELLAGLMSDATGQAFTTLMTDRVYRSQEPARTVDAARHLLRRLGIPSYLPPLARLQMRALLHAGPFMPGPAARAIHTRLRRETSDVIIPAEEPQLTHYLSARRKQGARVNINQLGEVVLGEAQAQQRIESYLAILQRPDTEAISIKISSIFSQIDHLAWDATLSSLCERLRAIYRVALAYSYERPDGTRAPKLVNLDMEAYRDLSLTLTAFRTTLDEAEFLPLTAGIVLQAYLPDSLPLQRDLTTWAQARVARGGAPIRLRIVKGANLLTERADSALRNLPLPIFSSKAEVDASYKAMVAYGCQPAQVAAVQLGVASHNLFDLAFGLVLRAAHDVTQAVSIELLEGMAEPVCRALLQIAGSALVYAPLCEDSARQTAIAYLIRRLDENTSEENFLRHSFGMRAGDAAWQTQESRFSEALAARASLDHSPRRAGRSAARVTSTTSAFTNEVDTDFYWPEPRQRLAETLARWQARPPFDVPFQIGGELRASAALQDGFDPSRPGIVPYRFGLATASDLERALATARRGAQQWGALAVEARAECLLRVATALRLARFELIGAMVLDAGKRADQADVEISEAIDFAEYYAKSFLQLTSQHPELAFAPRGVVLVTPPWNFPLAIALGGVFAALMAGNAVILKPALETVLVGERLAQLCWEGGVPQDVLQLVLCSDEIGSTLIKDPRVDQVVLTGATSTARLFQQLRPGLPLLAETGGKNALIVSALSDRDEAIKDALASAFGHAGQKCSACSLLICEAEVYDDPLFMATLRDAAASIPVGSSWEPRSVVTPLIRPPHDALLHALGNLDRGEGWLLQPERDPKNVRLWSPGIKLDVREGSAAHTTELFGPVLSVMRADDLDHALRIANATPYGLTAGLHSLDEGEQERWCARMRAGNLYINRPITGAIVQRQPFGGHKASSFGPGGKAGGPNYAIQLTHIRQHLAPPVVCPPAAACVELIAAVRRHLSEADRERLSIGACSYAAAKNNHFAIDHDPSGVLGERNVLRYLPLVRILIRASAGAVPTDVLLAVVAAQTANAGFELSLEPKFAEIAPYLTDLRGLDASIEDAASCAKRPATGVERIRALGPSEAVLRSAAEAAGVYLSDEPVLLTGRIELLRYHCEQSVSHRYHRYGNLAPEKLLRPLRGASS